MFLASPIIIYVCVVREFGIDSNANSIDFFLFSLTFSNCFGLDSHSKVFLSTNGVCEFFNLSGIKVNGQCLVLVELCSFGSQSTV